MNHPHPKGVVLDRAVATLQMENFLALLQGYHSIALSDNPTRRSQARLSALPSKLRSVDEEPREFEQDGKISTDYF